VKKKIIFFGDNNSFITSELYQSFIKNMDDKFELVAIVNTGSIKNSNKIKNYLIHLIKKLFNPLDKNIILDNSISFIKLIPENLLFLQTKNINDLTFVNKIKNLEADYAFLMGCSQILKKDIINCFERIINYHNSYLPLYRGLSATSWAMTHYKKNSGYTFHYINEKIDDGKIIFQEKININYSKSSFENELLKTQKASKNISKVFSLVLNEFDGIKQNGEFSYYGNKHIKKLLTFNKFENIKMIQRLIEIWGGVHLLSKNEDLFITKISNDGKIKRVTWLPLWIYFILKFINKKRWNR
jgi:methionyl-tRNA formyltransferase